MENKIFSKYKPEDRTCLIPILQDIQEKYGYLPENELQETADFINLPLSRVYGVATFYNQFRLVPLGENVIRVCRGTACHVKGSANILYALEYTLNIKAGETTRDKKFTIEVVNCIGACSIAPVITINNEYFGRLSVKDIPGLLKKITSKPAASKQEVVTEAAL